MRPALFASNARVSLLAICLAGASLGWAHPALADRLSHPTVVFSGLDKITGRIISFDVEINETVQFGTLQITPRVCYTRPQTETPLTDGFVEVDDLDVSNKTKRIFTGWMFAASPGLHGVEHPVYDVWLTNCKGAGELIATPPDVPAADADPASKTAPALTPPASGGAKPQRGGNPSAATPGAPPRAANSGGAIRQTLPPVGAPIEVGATPGTPRQTLPPPPPPAPAPAPARSGRGFDDGFGNGGFGNGGGGLVPPGSIPNGR